MAKGVLAREWDGFNLNRFHCTADTVAPEWRSSPLSLPLTHSGYLSEEKRLSESLWCTAAAWFAQTSKWQSYFFQKATHIWQLYSLLFFWLSSNSSSGAIICLCIKLGQWGTSVHGSCWLRDLGAAFRGNQRTKPWVTNWEIVLFAALWCTGTLLKQARCVC